MTFQQVSGTYLTEHISVAPIRIVLVHKKCLRDFTNQKRGWEEILKNKVPYAKRLTSGSFQFNWKEHFML